MTQRKGEARAPPRCAAVCSLLTTNSDDLGLGLPVMGALFKPELVQMCYVLNAMQAMASTRRSSCSSASGGEARRGGVGEAAAADEALVLSVLRGQTKNFLNIAVSPACCGTCF